MDLYKLKKVGKSVASTSGTTDNISMESINSELIKLTAKHTKRFLSDVLCDINAIKNYVITKEKEETEKTFFIGFRDDGVDGNCYIELSEPDRYKAIYGVYVYCDKRFDDYVAVDLHKVKLV